MTARPHRTHPTPPTQRDSELTDVGSAATYLELHVPEALGHGGGGAAATRGELAAPDLAALQLGGGVEDGGLHPALPPAGPGRAPGAVAVGAPPARRDAEAHPQLRPLRPVHPPPARPPPS